MIATDCSGLNLTDTTDERSDEQTCYCCDSRGELLRRPDDNGDMEWAVCCRRHKKGFLGVSS